MRKICALVAAAWPLPTETAVAWTSGSCGLAATASLYDDGNGSVNCGAFRGPISARWQDRSNQLRIKRRHARELLNLVLFMAQVAENSCRRHTSARSAAHTAQHSLSKRFSERLAILLERFLVKVDYVSASDKRSTTVTHDCRQGSDKCHTCRAYAHTHWQLTSARMPSVYIVRTVQCLRCIN